jgi:hypothetical protein
VKSLRWRMMALLMIGSIINYLTRSTLGSVGVAVQCLRRDARAHARGGSPVCPLVDGSGLPAGPFEIAIR